MMDHEDIEEISVEDEDDSFFPCLGKTCLPSVTCGPCCVLSGQVVLCFVFVSDVFLPLFGTVKRNTCKGCRGHLVLFPQ